MMSPETPNQTEARLQRYAKERRAQGGDFALHPATRRLLQDEVRRQHGPAAQARTGWAGWLGLWRGRLAIVGGVAAAVLFTTWMFWDSRSGEQPMQLAKYDAPQNQSRALEMERRGDEVLRDEAKQVGAEVALSKAKRDYSDDLTRQQTAPAVVTTTSSLTPVQKSLSDQAGANSLNRSLAPAQTFYANETAPIPQQDQSGLPPLERPAAPLSFQKAGAVADQRGLVASGPESQTRASLNLEENAPKRSDGLAEADKKQNATRFLSLADSAEPGVAGRSRRLNSNGPLLAGAAAKDVDAVVQNAPAAQALPVLAQSSPQGGLENQVALLAAPAPASASPAGVGLTDVYQRVETRSSGDSGAASLETLVQKPGGPTSRSTVLNDFTVERQGESLRLIDADGSVYEGTIDTTNVVAELNLATDRSGFKKEMVREPAAKAEAEAGRSYFFRATGSNVTLRQRVLVNGQMRATDDWMPIAGGAVAAERALSEQPNSATLSRFKATGGAVTSTNRLSTIEGTVQVGTTNEQPFRAVRRPRR